jgi:hypothetical protein
MEYSDPMFPTKRRRGKLHGFPAFLALLGIAALFPIGLYVLAPWTFYYGGHFHWIPGWRGKATFHTNLSGGDYFLWFYIEPSIPQYKQSDMGGTAILCTPHGERIPLTIVASVPRGSGKDLTSVPLSFSLHRLGVAARFNANYRPSWDLYGAFGQSELVVEDRGSIASAFLSDGTVAGPGQGRQLRPPLENVKVRLEETSDWTAPECPKLR